MAFFVTKSIAHIFTFPTLRSTRPSSLTKSDSSVIGTAIKRNFASQWESKLYRIVLQVFQRSMLDESVVVGMVVLLDRLGDVYKMGRYLDRDECKLILKPYPHDNYISYAVAAFMLSYRLLSKDRAVEQEFWEQIMQDIITPCKVHRLEKEFRTLLEENSKCYPPP